MATQPIDLKYFGQEARVTRPDDSPFREAFERLQALGLATDVLPAVWDPSLPLSANSRLRSIGKVPSLVNPKGEVVGIPCWTQKQSSDDDIASWARNRHYGVALQTRLVRAIDIDIEDAILAEAIANEFEAALGVKLPRRCRANSSKLLLAFACEGPLKKRSFRCGGGQVELLASGQQFIFHSVHPSGVNYEWEGGLPNGFPKIETLTLEEAWSRLASKYATTSARSRGGGPNERPRDAREAWLLENWQHHGHAANGYLHIECPFKDEHSGDSGPSECSYLPAGTNGYATGRYKCFHASCDERSQEEFDCATGYDRVAEAAGQWVKWPDEIVPGKGGAIPATLKHIVAALSLPGLCGGTLAFDAFLGEVYLRLPDGELRMFDDDERATLRLRIETAGFRPIKREDLREAARLVAKLNEFDSAQDWLKSLQWDGVARVERFLVSYMGAQDGPYAIAVSAYLWTALAGRTLFPGCQADMVPILSSPEGRGKSTTLQAIPPDPGQFAEISLHHRDDNLARLMKGKVLGEIAELRGLQRREVEAIKSFITRRWEEWTPKYVEKPVRYDRRLAFVGTTNDDQFLGSNTGERRWLPLIVGQCDRDRVVADRKQLWAEAKRIVERRVSQGLDPVAWEDAYQLAPAERENFTIEDWFESIILDWLGREEGQKAAKEGVTIDYLLNMVVGGKVRGTPFDQARLAQALRSCGFHQERKRMSGARRPRIWRIA